MMNVYEKLEIYHNLLQVTVPEFAGRDQGKPQRSSVRIDDSETKKRKEICV